MQELVIFRACEKYSGHAGADVTSLQHQKIGITFSVIFEVRRQFVLSLDGERNVKWCLAESVLNNRNLKFDCLF